MRATLRTCTALAVGAALVLFASPGGAQDGAATTPQAEAQSTGLRVSLFGNELIISAADTVASGAPSSSARGLGARLAVTDFGVSEASADASTPSAGSPDVVCAPVALPSGLPLPVQISVACSSAQATASGDGATATSSGEKLTLEVLSLDSILLPVDDLVDSLLASIGQLLGSLPLPLPVQLDQVTNLLQAAIDGNVGLLDVEVGDTDASSTVSAGAASATSSAEGLVVRVLDRGILGLEPVLTIGVGRSSATATWAAGSDAVSEHTNAPVTVRIAPDIAGLLGLPTVPIPVLPGQVLDLPLPAPLTSRVSVNAGTRSADGPTSRAVANEIRLDLLTGLPGGGVVVAVADAAAAVQGVVASDPPANPPTNPPIDPPAGPPANDPPGALDPDAKDPGKVGPAPRAAMPRTGGEGRWVPVAVLLALASGVALVALRRGRLVADQG